MGTKVKINNKNSGGSIITIVTLCIAIGVLGFFYQKYKTKYKEQKQISISLSQSINHWSDSVKTYKIKLDNGLKVSEGKVDILEIEKKNMQIKFRKELELAKRMGAGNGDINSIAETNIQTKDSAVYVPVYRDSLKSLHSTFDNGWNRADVTI